MQGSKIVAFLLTFSVAFLAIHFTILKPEGINIFDFDLPKISLPSFSSDSDEVKSSGKGSNSGSSKKSYRSRPSINGHVPTIVDKFNGVEVYQNGRETNVFGRNTTPDGYNLGLKYQCVEFVKRYYYEYYNHKMPNSYGHAREFYNYGLTDGTYNKDRALTQYSNPSYSKPQSGDIIIWGPTPNNQYGHVAVISSVADDHIQIVQQNGGQHNPTRINVPMGLKNGKFNVFGKHIVGWLRK